MHSTVPLSGFNIGSEETETRVSLLGAETRKITQMLRHIDCEPEGRLIKGDCEIVIALRKAAWSDL